MNRSAGSLPPATRNRPAADARSFDPESCVAAAAAGLLATIWLVPAEAALAGATGWRALLWIVLAVLWSAIKPGRSATTELTLIGQFLRWGCDLAVALIVGGQIWGGVFVLTTSGQKRFAANLLLEWIGLACAWWVLRGLLRGGRWRGELGVALVSVALAAAMLGIWQHYVSLPHMAAEFGPKLAHYRQALATGESTLLAGELAAAGIPTTEPGLTLFEKRLVDSREPFGMFALANTFGGMLASTLVWLAGARLLATGDVGPAPRRSWGGVAAWTTLFAVLAWSLVLTKSRTASLGFLVGLASVGLFWSTGERAAFSTQTRRKLWGAAGLVVTLIGVVPLSLIYCGVWDVQVLQEAPKSLLYRWQYWIGGSRLIAENPLLGIGLGQFRSAYLRVKLPEASEEISDPHNLWIDAWVNGGLSSVIGLVVGCVWLLSHVVQFLMAHHDKDLIHSRNLAAETNPANTRDRWSVVLGVGGAFALVFGTGLALGNWDDRLLALGVMWAAAFVYGLRNAGIGRAAYAGAAPLAGGIALIVHGHGAGGFELPGVVSWCGYLILLSLTPATQEFVSSARQSAAGQQHRGLAVMVTLLISAVGVGLWWPHLQCDGLLDQAQQLMMQGREDSSLKMLVAAAQADPWNPEPWQRKAELEFAHHSQSRVEGPPTSGINVELGSALDSLAKARQRDPANPHLVEREGDFQLAEFRRTKLAEWAQRAADSYRQAHQMYPTNALIAARWAEATSLAGEPGDAAQAARLALQQDDLNRRLGHVERWLSDADRKTLESMIEHSPASTVPTAP